MKAIRVMPLGDSITRGKGGSTWRHHLRNRLKAEGIRIQYVGSCPHAPNYGAPWSDHYLALQQALEYNLAHEGWGGLKIHELIGLKNHEFYPDFTIEELLEKNPPDLILLMIGTNDFKDDFEINYAGGRLDRLVRGILDLSPAYLLVGSILPIYAESDHAFGDAIKKYNSEISESINAYRSEGSPIGFVDMYPHFEKKDFLEDGVHPNLCGDRKIAEIWSNAILESCH